jgi:hypothetical protein
VIAELAEFARLVSMTPLGPVVEAGVYDSAYYPTQVAKDRGSELHLFDTFAGIPQRIEMDNHQVGDFGDETFPHLYVTVTGKAYVVKM